MYVIVLLVLIMYICISYSCVLLSLGPFWHSQKHKIMMPWRQEKRGIAVSASAYNMYYLQYDCIIRIIIYTLKFCVSTHVYSATA